MALHRPLPIAPASSAAAEQVPETRGLAIRYDRRFTSAELTAEIELAARAGFNLILFPVYVNGYTLFPSRAARAIGFDEIDPEYRRWNPLERALEVAHGLGVNVWGLVRPHNFNPHYVAGRHRLLREFPRWSVQCHPDHRRSPLRRRERYIACPVNPEYRRYVGDLLAELVQGYALDGLALHYRGYGFRSGSIAAHPFCFCQACRARFAEKRNADLLAKSRDDGGVAEIRGWQTRVSTSNLEYLRHRMTRTRRSMRLVAWAQPQWRWAHEETGPVLRPPYTLDWNRMLGSGAIEGIIVDHDEEIAPEAFASRLALDLAELHSEALILPSVRARGPEDLAAPLRAVRRYPATGLIAEFVEGLGPDRADETRERLFAERAQLPENSTLMSLAHLMRRIQSAHREIELIADLMRDFLRLIERAHQEGTTFHSIEIVYENLAGLQDSIRRGRLGATKIPESTLRDISLARRIARLACLEARP
jgi:hypothetical protein